ARNASDEPFGDGSTSRSPDGTATSEDGASEYRPSKRLRELGVRSALHIFFLNDAGVKLGFLGETSDGESDAKRGERTVLEKQAAAVREARQQREGILPERRAQRAVVLRLAEGDRGARCTATHPAGSGVL